MFNTEKWEELRRRVYARDFGREGPCIEIQIKGTDICGEVRCVCGEGQHLDGMFIYYVKCEGCGAKYAVGETLCLIPLSAEEEQLAADVFGEPPDFY